MLWIYNVVVGICICLVVLFTCWCLYRDKKGLDIFEEV